MARRRTTVNGRPRRLLLVGAVLVLLIGGGVIFLASRSPADDSGLAGRATVTASSTASGFSAGDAVKTRPDGSFGAGWQSDGRAAGAWIQLAWSQPHLLRSMVIVRNPLDQPGLTAGFLSFGDGSFLQVDLSRTSRETDIAFTPRTVGKVRFTASAVGTGARDVVINALAVSETPGIGDVVVDAVPDGNAAPSASVTRSSGSTRTPVGTWVQLNWPAPRELSSIQVVSGADSAAQITGGTVQFDDGTRIPVGAVLSDPSRPTTVGFMPRTTRSVRFTVSRATGTGGLTLPEFRAYQAGATPQRVPAAVAPTAAAPATVCGPPADTATADSHLIVTCPLNGTAVDGQVKIQVAVPTGYSSVTATVWPADATQPAGATVQATPTATATATATGATDLTVDTGSTPAGPLTVHVEATGSRQTTLSANLQLEHSGTITAGDLPASAAASGRTLVYDEEFDRPISFSRSGMGADYAAAKPTFDGAQDFGDAIFTHDGTSSNSMQVVDNRYLRIDVAPIAPGATDPAGFSRTHTGGLLASARVGGSGFSAQYGYFEARMLAPAATGTWPAFWMLPSDNLVAATPVVAEIDAVELYGHEPTGACQSTHQYKDGKDGGIASCGQRFPTERAALAWHTYGVSILPTGIVFSIDGKVVTTSPQVEGGDAPMFFLVDLALGGGWPVDLTSTANRAALYVDYVRVYV